MIMVPLRGIEPRFPDRESGVLPLDDRGLVPLVGIEPDIFGLKVRYPSPLDDRGVAMTKTMEQKVWSKIQVGGPDECWKWQGFVKSARPGASKYGRLNVRVGPRLEKRHRDLLAHRLVYELEYGPIPKGFVVRHRCNNTLCCNPAHLILGTHQDNMDDMTKAGSVKGERNPRSKITWQDVRRIRRLRFKGWTLKAIAREFPVTLATVGLICQNKIWIE